MFLSSCRKSIQKRLRKKPYIDHCPGPIYPPLRIQVLVQTVSKAYKLYGIVITVIVNLVNFMFISDL